MTHSHLFNFINVTGSSDLLDSSSHSSDKLIIPAPKRLKFSANKPT